MADSREPKEELLHQRMSEGT